MGEVKMGPLSPRPLVGLDRQKNDENLNFFGIFEAKVMLTLLENFCTFLEKNVQMTIFVTTCLRCKRFLPVHRFSVTYCYHFHSHMLVITLIYV